MGNMSVSLVIILAFLFFIFYYSQTKFKNKMLCTFIRPNRTKIEKWVPLYSKYVIFDRGKYGIGHYDCNPNCIILMWYARGFNRFFPILVPTLEFKWDTQNPLNPKTFESTWASPEQRNAAWEEHQHIAFAKAAAAQAGRKSRFPEWFFPLITLGVVLIVMWLVWGLNARIEGLEQFIINK